MKNKLVKGLLYFVFILYLAILVKIVLLKYHSILDIFPINTEGFRSYNIIPFKILSDFSANLQSDNWLWGVSNILGNIAIFSPLGLLLPILFKKMRENYLLILISSVTLSLAFETLQYLLYLGSADIDDVILNTLGGCIGIAVYHIISKISKGKEFIAQCVTLCLTLIMSIPAFYVAKNQFGNLLGLTHIETNYEGNENIPTREPNISGTLIEINKSSIQYYKGYLSSNKVENDFLKNGTSKITNETKIYKLNIIEGKNKATFEYSPLSINDLNSIEKNSLINLWLKEDNTTVDVIVISKPLDTSGETSVMTGSSKPNDSKKDRKSDNISGHILNIKGNDITLNLMITQDLGNGQSMATSGVGENAIKVHVKLKDTTTYIKRTSKDMGITSTDKSATKSDLLVDSSINITGTKKGDTFIADSIIIYEFK